MPEAFTALRLTTPILVSFIAAIVLIIGGGFLFLGPRESKRADIGASLLTGAIFLVAAALNQLTIDASAFKQSIATTSDLTGFDPDGRSMSGLTLAGKNLHAAQLRGAYLERTNVSYSNLNEAILAGAHAQGARFFYATLHGTDLKGIDMRDADLIGAEIATSSNGLKDAQLQGAKVHKETCWQISLEDQPQPTPKHEGSEGQKLLELILNSGLTPVLPARMLGHVCTKKEGNPTYPYDEDHRVYICASQPYLQETAEDCP